MSDLKNYVSKRKAYDLEFSQGYEEGYQSFKIGILSKQAQEKPSLVDEEATEKVHTRRKIHTKRLTISRIEDHAEGIKACCN